MTSIPKTRTAYFDAVLAGPAVALLAAVAALVVGAALGGAGDNTGVSIDDLARVPADALERSALTSTVLAATFGKQLGDYFPGQQQLGLLLASTSSRGAGGVPVHPLFAAGAAVAPAAALQLLPLSGADGLRLFDALFGKHYSSSFISKLVTVVVAVGAGVRLVADHDWGRLAALAVYAVLAAARGADPPCEDDVTPPPDSRYVAYWLVVALAVLALAPSPLLAGRHVLDAAANFQLDPGLRDFVSGSS